VINFEANNQLSAKNKEATGATLVEFTLVFMILFSCIMAIIEVGRYALIKSLLQSAAHDALNYAQKVSDFDVDLREASNEQYNRFKQARASIVEVGSKLPRSFLNDFERDSVHRMSKFKNIDLVNATSRDSEDVSILVLRPGEYGYDEYAHEYVSHPTLCAPSGGTCAAGVSRASSTQDWNELIYKQPIYVQVSAIYRTLIPLPFRVAERSISAVAIGYREPPTNTTAPANVPILAPPPPPPATCKAGAEELCNGLCYNICTAPMIRNAGTCVCYDPNPPADDEPTPVPTPTGGRGRCPSRERENCINAGGSYNITECDCVMPPRCDPPSFWGRTPFGTVCCPECPSGQSPTGAGCFCS
jgi:hypothetical protein